MMLLTMPAYIQYIVSLCLTASKYLPIPHGAFSLSLHLNLMLFLFTALSVNGTFNAAPVLAVLGIVPIHIG